MSNKLFEEIKNIMVKSRIQQIEIDEAIKKAKKKCSGEKIEEANLQEISQELRNKYVMKASSENTKAAINRLSQAAVMPEKEWQESGEKIKKRNDRIQKELARPVSEESLFTAEELAKLEEIAKMIDEGEENPHDVMLSLAKKINPNARKRPSVEVQKQERDEMIKSRKIQSGVNPPLPNKEPKEAYPLGGYDPKSNRSYSD